MRGEEDGEGVRGEGDQEAPQPAVATRRPPGRHWARGEDLAGDWPPGQHHLPAQRLREQLGDFPRLGIVGAFLRLAKWRRIGILKHAEILDKIWKRFWFDISEVHLWPIELLFKFYDKTVSQNINTFETCCKEISLLKNANHKILIHWNPNKFDVVFWNMNYLFLIYMINSVILTGFFFLWNC